MKHLSVDCIGGVRQKVARQLGITQVVVCCIQDDYNNIVNTPGINNASCGGGGTKFY
jgi:hypothetical protein